jgi:hypothetical protein
MTQTQNSQLAAGQTAGARGGPGNRTPAVNAAEIYSVRSYMFDIETRESLWLDRIRAGNPWVEDIARVLEYMATKMPAVATVLISDEYVALKIKDKWKIAISRDSAVAIKVPDCALIADDRFLLLCMDDSGLYKPIAKSETITWDGTEEFFEPADIRRLVKETLQRVFERVRWLRP